MIIPEFIQHFIQKRIPPNFGNSVCGSCNSNCCKGPGFALLENVLKIFEKYLANQLSREDFEFEKNLDLSSFIFKYFDRVLFNNSLLVFFPKSITDKNELVSISPWNYYEARFYLHARIINKGCIFLNRKFSNDQIDNYCILHQNSIENEISTKPLDCIFLTCTSDKKIVNPTPQETAVWLSLIDYYFPKSKDRFNSICPDVPA